MVEETPLETARLPSAAASRTTRLRDLISRSWPYALFAALLLYGWRNWHLASTLPGYDDTLEIVWILRWVAGALSGLHGIAAYPLAFYPAGWHVASYGLGPAMFIPMLPLYWLGGAAFAYNILTLLSFPVAFVGMYKLARIFVPGKGAEPRNRLPATVAALLFTFWGFRWFRIDGHLNILVGSALLPWMAWSLERWLDMQRSSRRGYKWLVLIGLLWALAIQNSWYFAWIVGVLLAAWLGGYLIASRIGLRRALVGLGLPALIALVASAPWIFWFVRENAAAGVLAAEVSEVSMWDASLNALAAPTVSSPWLGAAARWIYRGRLNEPGLANLGFAACLVALVGLWRACRDRRWWPVVMCAGIGLVLALGLWLHWNGKVVHWAALRPLNALIWQIGHAIKPDVFVSTQPTAEFATAVPLPGLLLSAAIPLMDRARVFARYALAGGIGLYLLVALGLGQLRKTWAQALLAGLLIFELLPPPSHEVPFPPPSHPAFDWLAEQKISPAGIIDLGSWQQDRLYLTSGGNAIWATEFHGQPTVAGTGSSWPAQVVFLSGWLQSNPHAFRNPDFIPLLRFYGVRYIVFHVAGGYARELLEEARQNPQLQNMRCFEPSSQGAGRVPVTSGPWDYPICIMQLPPGEGDFNVLFREGWSGSEEWGRWVEGTEARAAWVATSRTPHTIALKVFPLCVPDRKQRLGVEVNGVELTSHEWQGCEEWAADIGIPDSLTRIGQNEVVLRSDYALRPVDVTDGQNEDTRPLSLGVTRFEVMPDAGY